MTAGPNDPLGPAPATLPHWLVATARHRRQAVALIDRRRTVTYGQLLDEIGRAAGVLTEAGLQRGHPVCFAMAPSADHAIWIFGCLLAGGVPAPVNTRLSATEVAAYTTRLRPALRVGDRQHMHLFGASDELSSLVIEPGRLEPGGTPSGEHDRQADAMESTVDGLLDRLDERAPAIIFPTGGTTGLPKGAFTDHRGLLHWTWNIALGSRRHGNETELYFSPFFHVSLMVGVFAALFAGGTIVIEPSFDAGRALELIGRLGITRLMGAPTMFVGLMNHPDACPEVFEQVRDITCGAAASTDAFTTRLLAEFANARVVTGYGATELASGVSRIDDDDLRAGRIDGVGRPNVGCQIRIIDAGGNDVEPGQIGEVIVRSPWQTLGYWNQPDETAATYRSDGFINLGDLGTLDDTGWLRIVGRTKEMIITGGENVYPIEVEQVLGSVAGVAEVVVFGVPDPVWGERVEAVVTAAPGVHLDPDELRRTLRTQLGGYKIPKRIHVVDAIPLTANNKPDRRALAARYTDGVTADSPSAPAAMEDRSP